MDDAERKAQEAARARAVEFWRQHDEMEARLTRPVSERMLDLAGVSAGMQVLDVAAGRGEPALPAAHRVGAHGRVLAVDPAEGVLQIARERARREGLTNVEFQVADAEALRVEEGAFDVATLRWGLMYMREPERALQCIHRALKPGGAFVIASWAEPHRVPWAWLGRRMLERYRDVSLPIPGSDGPGVFRHADPAVLDAALRRNGFSVETSEDMDIPVVEASDGSGIVAWLRQLGGPLVKLVDELPEHQQRAWEEDISAEVEKHRVGETVTLGGVTRLTLAKAVGVP
ncbi:class I SAM-dependent methyltransferase [Pyxidicoccus parkwayensis]|uniref:Class I SAM-dependent methyltransferase n=1 Tax=Pyxidicoccus parkwayensis TaxID=2813578 RepID=A0ABX7P9T4_9BACT|nr:methyltransferase domain-containing protein [Pyxidicoccus parkwaysis]QSQ27201.1 class I SAM-dependent methyltransferase [Pyxidicoccus parkwaysis]